MTGGAASRAQGAHYLAIAILADLIGRGERLHRGAAAVLRRFLARLPKDGFEISDTVFYALFSAISAGARAEHQNSGGARSSVGRQSMSGA